MTYDIVFLAGILSFFSPCIIPLLPIYVAQLSKGAAETRGDVKGKVNWRLMAQTIVFVMGIETNFVLLGFGAGALGNVFGSETFLVICGTVAIGMGLYKIGIIKIDFLARERKVYMTGTSSSSVVSAYLLGFTFSFGWTPCIGPVLATVLGVASNQGQGLYAAVLMFIYGAGLAIPFILISALGNVLLDRVKVLHPYLRKIEIASGVLIILMGILLMTNQLNRLAAL